MGMRPPSSCSTAPMRAMFRKVTFLPTRDVAQTETGTQISAGTVDSMDMKVWDTSGKARPRSARAGLTALMARTLNSMARIAMIANRFS